MQATAVLRVDAKASEMSTLLRLVTVRQLLGRLAWGASLVYVALALTAGAAFAASLPDGRSYEKVTPLNKNGIEVGVGIGSIAGNAVNWEAIGGCCGATSAALNLYQSVRTASGWKTTAKTPMPPKPLVGLFQEQAPMWWSSNLNKTIYLTPASYASGDKRPAGPGSTSYDDLYEQAPAAGMTWISQGPFPGAGRNPDTATWAATTPNGNSVLFNTQEQLTSDATGLASLNTPPEFLYDRNVAAGTTTLVDVTTTKLTAAAGSGTTTIVVASTSAFAPGQTVTIGRGAHEETDTVSSVPDSTHIDLNSALVNHHGAGASVEALISPDGAIAGNGNWLDQPFLPANYYGTTTNSISSDGTRIFFESPPTFAGGSGGAEGVGPAHLYMRDLANSATTQLDANPSAPGQAVYEGASRSGSLVFFTSNEGLAGDSNADNELYEFNSTGSTIGPAAPMSVIPLSDGGDTSTDGDVVGVTAISNDGSHIYFVAEGVLASNQGAQGETATQGALNFYVVDTTTGATTFIARLGSGVSDDSRDSTALAGEPDINRAAVPTPDGNTLVFESTANLTGQNPSGPTTALAANASPGDTTIKVASTKGLVAGRPIEIEDPILPERATIAAVKNSTHLQLASELFFSLSAGDSVVQLPPFEIYRYSTGGSLTCVSCPPAHVKPTGSAGLGASGGGSYGPPSEGVPMSSDGSRIFFDSPDPLVKGVIKSPPIPIGLFGGLTFVTNVYEWENGHVSVISDGLSTTGSALGSTTPSGNDVFFTTEDQLVPKDTDGWDDVYDARVGGGFQAGAARGSPARSGVSTGFSSLPVSATLIQPNAATAPFAVGSISSKQRRQFAETGSLTLRVRVSEPGRVTAVASTVMKNASEIVASAKHSSLATQGTNAKLTLRLSNAARTELANDHKLIVQIAVSYAHSSQVKIASLVLTKGRG